MRRSLACAVLVVAVLASALALPAGSRAATIRAMPMGGFVDSMLWYDQPNQAQALLDLKNGVMDIYTFPLRTATDVAAAHSDPDLRTVDSYGVEDNLFVNPVPVNQSLAPGVFNPFANPEARRALNYLIDRDYINDQMFAGYGLAHAALWNPVSPEVARDPFFFSDLNRNHSYDYARGRSMMFDALNASGATYDGTWTWQGNPIVINLIQRIEDQRFQIGQYVADQLTPLGLQVSLIPKSAGGAFAIVYNGPPDTGAWMLYTEGWSFTWLQAWADGDLDFFNNGGEASAIWYTSGGPYQPDPELMDIATRLKNEQYLSLAERQQLVERGAVLALDDSVRVWLVASETFVYSKRVTNLVSSYAGGLWSPFTMRTARFASPGGSLQIGQRFQFLSPWQPWQGFGWIYDLFVGDAFMDPGLAIHPHTGEYIPVRSDFDVATAGPTGSLDVPSDAIVYDPATDAWESVPAGSTATSMVTFNYTFGDWHHGVSMNMNDVLYNVALIARRDRGDVAAHDSNALNEHDRTFASLFRGLRVIDSDTLEVYIDFWHLDSAVVAAAADVWPSTPWEVGELAMSTTLHDHTRVSDITAANDGLDVIDLAIGPAIGWMDGEFASGNITTTGPGVTRPAGFSGFIGPSEAQARWAGLQTWRSNHADYFPSNGPYYLDSANAVSRQAVLRNFASYPFSPDRWDSLLTSAVPDVGIDPIPDVVAGDPAQVTLTTNLAGQPYDNATVRYRIILPASGATLLSGQASLVGPGAWRVDLNEAFTSNLSLGTYRFDASAVGNEASISAYANRSFAVVSPADTTAPTSGIDALPTYWQTAGPFHLQVTATDDRSGVTSVDLYAAYSADGIAWPVPTLTATDASPPFAFDFAPADGDGWYRFWTLATDGAGNSESWSNKPTDGQIEVGLDTATPTSGLAAPASYWQVSSSLSLPADATDATSGVASLQLYFSYSSDGASWSTPALAATDDASPFLFTFDATQGDGRYRFWSLATDQAGNTEPLSSKPANGDIEVGLDSLAPTAALAGLPSYWLGSAPVSLQASVIDATSGVATVDLYVSFSADGAVWPVPTKVATDASAPFAFAYTPTQGDGLYRFWALATDQAGNAESLGSQPAIGEAAIGLDTVVPTATVGAVGSYWRSSASFSLQVTATDDRSGVASVSLYVSFSADGITWSAPTLAATNNAAPFSFTYAPTQGDGRYRFWALATDVAGNAEPLSSQAANGEVEVGLDTVAPTVTASLPADGATGVSTSGTAIRVTFSEAVDHLAAQSAFAITPSVTGSFSWDGNTLVFSPSVSLASGTGYEVTIHAGVTDAAGNGLATDYTVSFATESAPPPPASYGWVLPVGLAVVVVVAVAVILRWRSTRRKR